MRSRHSSHEARSRPSVRFSTGRSSPRASICGSARAPGACARASCRDRIARSRIALRSSMRMRSTSTTSKARCSKEIASTSPRSRRASHFPPPCRPPPIPKSSTGRLDVFTRVITDRADRFDIIKPGYAGKLYAEVSPRTFPVLARRGSRLAQLRLRTGEARLDDDELAKLHERETLVAGLNPSFASGHRGERRSRGYATPRP